MARPIPGDLDMGAIPVPEGVRFRVWAPDVRRVEVELNGEATRRVSMDPGGDGTWEATIPGLGPGARYKYRLDAEGAFPGPYSASQPDGVHGPSEVVDPGGFTWRERDWKGIDPACPVIYECHVGTATPSGTFDALAGQLPALKELGFTAIQVMPVAQFPGRRNWGYDGVYPFAVAASYGGVDGFKRLVDAAHRVGIGVILDVVYNHLGPEGNYLRRYSRDYFTSRYQTPWGKAINYDGPNSEWVRKYFIDNACYWIHEFHVDGLRLDAAFKIHDGTRPHVLQELTQAARRAALYDRRVFLIAETAENDPRYVLGVEEGGFGFDAVYADDFHHSLRRYLMGDHEGYYRDYEGTLEELARTINQGFLYEGQPSRFWGARRGAPARDRPAREFLYFIQNHDQVGNRALGDRLHHQLDLGRYRVVSALLLLLPFTPLIFMGQEFAASSPFQYFTDHGPELGRLVTEGRRREFADYSAFSDPASVERIPDPQAEETFLRSKLDLDEASRAPGAAIRRLYEELLRLRRANPVIARLDRHSMRAQAITPDLLVVHFWHDEQQRLLVANFGADTSLNREDLPRELPAGSWRPLLDTNQPRFGGSGTLASVRESQVHVPGRSAALLANE